MTYQVLARKWRPRFFREMVGQEHVLKALINALDNNRLHQAYLFTGTRGVGKTTIARILAKCLNCETGVTSEPCGVCSSCVEISQGSFVDLIEIDAASHTGVDNMRTITDNAQYMPSKGRYKVYLIDEVHMLTQHSFNALLKTLEEPPEHTKFLLATTDPQKLPATVLSRCLQFHLKNMVPEHIVQHLQHVLQSESMSYEDAALWALARAAQGSMRDALSLTDQAIAFGQGEILLHDVASMLGTIDQQTVHQLADALIDHDASKILSVVASASELSPDYVAILDALLLLLHRLSVAQLVPQAVDNSEGDQQQILQQAARISAGELQLFYQMGLLGKRDIYLAPDMRTGLEMALLRMLAFRPHNMPEPVPGIQLKAEDECVKKPEAVAPVIQTAATAAPASTKENPFAVQAITPEQQQSHSKLVPVPQQVMAEKASALPLVEPTGDEHEEPAKAEVNAVAQPLAPLKAEVLRVHEPAVLELTASQRSLPQQQQQWLDQFVEIPFNGLLRMVMSECVFIRGDEQRLCFALHPDKAQLYNARHGEQAAQVFSEYTGQSVSVQIELVEHALQTPQEYMQENKTRRREKAISTLNDDAIVQYFVEHYQAQIVPDAIYDEGERL